MRTALIATAVIAVLYGTLALIEIGVDWFCATFDEVQIGLGLLALATFGFIRFLTWAMKGETNA